MNEEPNSNKPYFFLNFLTEYTHDNFAIPSYIDQEFKEMIENFDKLGYLDNTLLFIFSDHGSRLSSYAYQTDAGMMEKNLPFVSIRLPKILWNSQYQTNLLENKNKLVTAFDIFQTLRHFYHLNGNYSKELDRNQFKLNDKNVRQLRGISLFEEIPINRSCNDAFIPVNFCSCNSETIVNEVEFKSLSNFTFNEVSNFIIKYINNLNEKFRNICELFYLHSIHRVRKLVFPNQKNLFQFVLIVSPGDAWFQIVIKLNQSQNNTDKPFSVFGKVVRESPYGNQSHCIENWYLKNYCYCKDLLL
jgi:hypothetical protein